MKTRTAILPALLLAAGPASAACTFEIEVGDSLQYDTRTMSVDADCASVTVNLRHTGNLPAAAMGHNWVLTTPEDVQGVATAGIGQGLENDYLPASDERVLAATSIVGGGESTMVTFSLDDLPGQDRPYTFFCSFPGHYTVMQGTLTVD